PRYLARRVGDTEAPQELLDGRWYQAPVGAQLRPYVRILRQTARCEGQGRGYRVQASKNDIRQHARGLRIRQRAIANLRIHDPAEQVPPRLLTALLNPLLRVRVQPAERACLVSVAAGPYR